tara:strand:+ start:950 stop:1168 length:219 start_codon:yes stop_codon:yes gene_type:complete
LANDIYDTGLWALTDEELRDAMIDARKALLLAESFGHRPGQDPHDHLTEELDALYREEQRRQEEGVKWGRVE